MTVTYLCSCGGMVSCDGCTSKSISFTLAFLGLRASETSHGMPVLFGISFECAKCANRISHGKNLNG